MLIPNRIALLVDKRPSDQRFRILGIIQIKLRIRCHGENRPGIHIHDDTAGIIGSVSLSDCILILRIKFVQIFFCNRLQIAVNGRHDRFAIVSRNDRSLQIGVIVQITVLPAICPDQRIIIILFQSIQTVSVTRGKTDDITGKRLVRVGSPIAILEPYALDIFVIMFAFRIGQILEGRYVCK